jgi:hypothetical protein
MRAAVRQGEELTGEIEDHDPAARHLDKLAGPGCNCINRRDHIFRHSAVLVRAACARNVGAMESYIAFVIDVADFQELRNAVKLPQPLQGSMERSAAKSGIGGRIGLSGSRRNP